MIVSPYDPVAVQSMLGKISEEHCAKTIIERDSLKRKVDSLQSALDLCIEALEAVEWQENRIIRYCPWCHVSLYHYAVGLPIHADDCLHQRALATAKGE